MDLEMIKTDQDLENQGAWVKLDHLTEVKIRSTSSRLYQEQARKKYGPLASLVEIVGVENVSRDQQEQMVQDLMAEVLIVDWKGLTDKGVDVPYSLETAREIVKIPRFRDLVWKHAQALQTFKAKSNEGAAKNS